MIKKDIPNCENCLTRKLSIFAGLPSDDLKNISTSKRCVYFKKGQELFHEGVNANGIYCIYTGKLKFARIGVEGKEQIIRFGKKGDIVGYRSLLSRETVSANVIALNDVVACYIPKDIIVKMISKDALFTSQLLMKACHELGEAGKFITNLAQKSVRERLAEVLLILHTTFDVDDLGFIDVNLKREEIASVVGTATETVIRFLSEFKADGNIELNGSRIKLLNLNKLADIGSVYDY